jgi:hypothetical protein
VNYHQLNRRRRRFLQKHYVAAGAGAGAADDADDADDADADDADDADDAVDIDIDILVNMMQIKGNKSNNISG